MDKKVARALRAGRRQYQDGGFTSDTEQDQMRAASDPHRYERFVEPVAKGVQWLKDMVKAPFDMARDAREAGGYSNLDPSEVGRAGLNTGLGALAPAAGLATGALPKGSGFVLSSGGAPSEPKGIRAYHGSPHDFDRFDLSKIGTGEGAQAYGHGLYFAEAEDVARSYRDTLSGFNKAGQTQGWNDAEGNLAAAIKKAVPQATDMDAQYLATNYLQAIQDGMDLTKLRKDFRSQYTGKTEIDDYMRRAIDAAHAEANALSLGQGRMYEVRIDADPNDFLDWDKPLSEQPAAVQKLISEHPRMGPAVKSWSPREFGAGSAVWRAADELTGNEARAAEALKNSGIPGIKYLDAGSRSAGDGSRNYVLFRDDIISIVRKYGMAAAVSMYGADAVTNAMQDAGTP